MVEAAAVPELPDFRKFLDELEDVKTARDFLMHIVGHGYVIQELKDGQDVRNLADPDAVVLAKSYWGIFFLSEYPDYGEYDQ